MNFIPKAGLVISATILTGLLVITSLFNESTFCKGRGFMGSSSSCVDVLLSSYLGVILIFLIILFGIWTTIGYMNSAVKPKTTKKTKSTSARGTIKLTWTRNHSTYVTPRAIAWAGAITTCAYVLFIPLLDLQSKFETPVQIVRSMLGLEKLGSTDLFGYTLLSSYFALISILSIWIYGLVRYLNGRKGWTKSSLIWLSFIVIAGVLVTYTLSTILFGFHNAK